MKRTYNSEAIIIDNVFVGISLGADFCYEHECGIQDLLNNFGCDKNKEGFDKNIINILPDSLKFYKFSRYKKPCYAIYCENVPQTYDFRKNIIRPFDNEKMICAYDNDSFQIVFKEDGKQMFKDLKEAFENKDIAIMKGENGHVFKNAGIQIVIASRFPEEKKEEILRKDKEERELLEDFRKTKIVPLLNFCKKGFYALVPKRYDGNFKPEGRNLKTKYNVVAFLNPMEQQKYKSGWYTIEELRAWAFGKGIIVKKENANE